MGSTDHESTRTCPFGLSCLWTRRSGRVSVLVVRRRGFRSGKRSKVWLGRRAKPIKMRAGEIATTVGVLPIHLEYYWWRVRR